MKAKDFIPSSKPRNFVAKNQQTAGAGAHKDKKKAEKQGDIKHKKQAVPMEDAAGVGIVTKQNATVDVPVGGEYMNVKKFFPKKKKVKEQGVAEASKGQKFIVTYHNNLSDDSYTVMVSADDEYDAKDKVRYALGMGDRITDVKSARGNEPTDREYKVFVDPRTGQGRSGIYDRQQGVSERVRDPEDWDEGNTEPPNNFAVYINGKKWKVFKGRGQFADDYKERDHYRQLQNWAQAKSQTTGKKWTVSITGEAPTA